MFDISDINEDKVGRPSELAPLKAKARKAWVCFTSDKFRSKMSALEQKVRFELYRELDADVIRMFNDLITKQQDAGETVDRKECMITAGQLVAAELD